MAQQSVSNATKVAEAVSSIEETISAITRKVTIARSVVSVTSQALYHGNTDLEMQAGETLQPAADTLDEVINELCSLRLDLPKETEESPQ